MLQSVRYKYQHKDTMRPEDYPPQEPVSDFARDYNEYLLKKAAELGGAEELYGADPYQSVLYFPAPDPMATCSS